MLGGPGAERLAEGLVVLVVQLGEEEEKTGVVQFQLCSYARCV